jgi:hypothetical protein
MRQLYIVGGIVGVLVLVTLYFVSKRRASSADADSDDEANAALGITCRSAGRRAGRSAGEPGQSTVGRGDGNIPMNTQWSTIEAQVDVPFTVTVVKHAILEARLMEYDTCAVEYVGVDEHPDKVVHTFTAVDPGQVNLVFAFVSKQPADNGAVYNAVGFQVNVHPAPSSGERR